jgi:hypothetical protein
MVNILYFATNIGQCQSFTQWIIEKLCRENCPYTYDEKFQAIQTEHATLYVKTYYGHLLGMMSDIKYHLFKFNFDELSINQEEELYNVLKYEVKPKYRMDAEPLTCEVDILTILIKGANEYEQKCFIKRIKGEIA